MSVFLATFLPENCRNILKTLDVNCSFHHDSKPKNNIEQEFHSSRIGFHFSIILESCRVAIWRFLKMVVPPKSSKLDPFSIETYGDLGIPPEPL